MWLLTGSMASFQSGKASTSVRLLDRHSRGW